MEKTINNLKILIYDDKNIKYKTGYCASIDVDCGMPIDVTSPIDSHGKYMAPMNSVLTCSISNYEELNNIELDETTMKRIAKYNKEQECKRLDEKIKEKKEKIKELDDYLKDKEKRVEKLKKYIINIFDIDINDDEDDYWED